MTWNRPAIGMVLTASTLLMGLAVSGPGCSREERGPMLAGGREVKSWVNALHDPKPSVRRQAVLKLGNVGDADVSVAEALAEALRDPDALVRHDAVLALAKLRQPGEAIKAQLETMSRGDKDARVRDVSRRAVAHLAAGK
jgi:HEAT repeat protein